MPASTVPGVAVFRHLSIDPGGDVILDTDKVGAFSPAQL